MAKVYLTFSDGTEVTFLNGDYVTLAENTKGYLVPGIGWVEDRESGNSILYPGGAFQESEIEAELPDVQAALTGESSTSTAGIFGNSLNTNLIGNFGLFEHGGYSYLVDENGAYIIDENDNYIVSNNPTFLVEHDNALTGELLDVVLGFLAPLGDVITGLTGQSIAATFGQLLPSSEGVLIGESGALSAGDLSIILSNALVGRSMVAIRGALTVNTDKGIVSTIITTDIGDLLVSSSLDLLGLEITVLNGDVSVLDGDVVRQLTGSGIAAGAGQLVNKLNRGITGQVLALSDGVIFAASDSLISGQSLIINQGGLSVKVSVTPTGKTIVSGAGTLVFDLSDIVIDLVGQSIATSQGILIIEGLKDRHITKVLAMGNSYAIINLTNNIKVLH